MRVTSFLGLSVVVFLVSASACDDGAGAGGGGTGELTIDSYYDAFAAARCTYFVRCGYVPDLASCEEAYGADRAATQGVASVVFGSLGFDPAAAKTCIDSFPLAICDRPPAGGYPDSIDTACAGVFTGKAANDSPCFSGVECQSGTCEAANCNQACCEGKCKAADLVPDGGDCSGDATCVDGDYCDTTAMPTCKKQKGANEACTNPLSCVPGYLCDTAAGKCFKQSPSGASCNPTLNAACEQGGSEYCNPDTKVCTPLPRPGEPCVASGPNMGACARDATCGMGMICTVLPLEGDPCLGDTCMGTMTCDMDSKTCERRATVTCVPN